MPFHSCVWFAINSTLGGGDRQEDGGVAAAMIRGKNILGLFYSTVHVQVTLLTGSFCHFCLFSKASLYDAHVKRDT